MHTNYDHAIGILCQKASQSGETIETNFGKTNKWAIAAKILSLAQDAGVDLHLSEEELLVPLKIVEASSKLLPCSEEG